jgi:hypothetical protein
MFQKLFKFIKNILWLDKPKEIVVNFGNKDELPTSAPETDVITKPKTEQVAEVPFFTRANNLVAEFAYEPTPVYSSVFGGEDDKIKPVGYLQSDGTITKTEKNIVDDIIVQDKEELLHDDVEFLKKDNNYADPKLKEQSTTVNFKDHVSSKS